MIDAASEPFMAFCMQLRAGCEDEYERRHDAIWPELVEALLAAGVRDYSIFFDAQSLTLLAVLRPITLERRERLAREPVMRRWWDHIADLMLVQADHRPVERSLQLLFSL